MHQALGIVLIVLFVLACVIIGLFCLSVIEEERSNACFGGGKDSPQVPDDESKNDSFC